MASDPPLQAIFGPNATQTATQIIIAKADLIAPVELNPSYTFTPADVNTAESIMLAMYLRWLRNQDQSADAQIRLLPFEMSLDFSFSKYQRLYLSQFIVRVDDTLALFPNPSLV